MEKILLLGMIVIVGIPLWVYISYKSYKRKLSRIYDEIKIGDRFFFTIYPKHPFDEKRTYTATIIDKTLAEGKNPWVQYRYDDGSVSQDELDDFLTFHEKISE